MITRRTISSAAEFKRVYELKRSTASRNLVLYVAPVAEGVDGPRLGLSISTKVGKATKRNRVKRVLREAFWVIAPTLPEGYDYVLIARQPSVGWVDEATPAVVQAEISSLQRRLLARSRAGSARTTGDPLR